PASHDIGPPLPYTTLFRSGIGGGIGIGAAGPLVDHLGVSSIFWLSTATTVAAVIAARLFVPASPVKEPAKIDWLGGLLLSATLRSEERRVGKGCGSRSSPH